MVHRLRVGSQWFRLKIDLKDSIMARRLSTIDSLTKLLDESSRPIYAIDAAAARSSIATRRLATWLGFEPKRIVGRRRRVPFGADGRRR